MIQRKERSKNLRKTERKNKKQLIRRKSKRKHCIQKIRMPSNKNYCKARKNYKKVKIWKPIKNFESQRWYQENP